VVALPPEELVKKIELERGKLKKAKPQYRGDRRRSVFVSRRFIETKTNIDITVRIFTKSCAGPWRRALLQRVGNVRCST
jgi:hypothetical protein